MNEEKRYFLLIFFFFVKSRFVVSVCKKKIIKKNIIYMYVCVYANVSLSIFFSKQSLLIHI